LELSVVLSVFMAVITGSLLVVTLVVLVVTLLVVTLVLVVTLLLVAPGDSLVLAGGIIAVSVATAPVVSGAAMVMAGWLAGAVLIAGSFVAIVLVSV
jgi:hypothetical protein